MVGWHSSTFEGKTLIGFLGFMWVYDVDVYNANPTKKLVTRQLYKQEKE